MTLDSDSSDLYLAFFSSANLECVQDALRRKHSTPGDAVLRLLAAIDSAFSCTTMDRIAAAIIDYRAENWDNYPLLLFAHLRWREEPRLDDLLDLQVSCCSRRTSS